MYGKCLNDFCILFCFFLDSEAQELGSIGVTGTVITYYENQQQLLPSYMTLLAWSLNGMRATF